MSSQTNLCLLATVMLITALCASAAPLADAHTDSPSGEVSGEEEEGQITSYPPVTFSIQGTWEQVIGTIKRHQPEFEGEFSGNVRYDSLGVYSSFPEKCSNNNSKEACLQMLAQGLHKYMVLLKHVEKEYPNSSVLTEVKANIPLLIAAIKAKMRNSNQVSALTSSQQDQLLKELNNPDAFTRKMKAHSILFSLQHFLIDGLRYFRKWDTPNEQAVSTNGQ